MSGVEDLDQYGGWSNDPDYGPVWTPTVIVAGWAPYSFGHWAWVDPWGWTWIDDAPWGFAPFHYGRWAFRSNAWRWVPGAHISRAVYAPALVTFVGGGDWRSSSAPGGSVGWFALGPHEPFVAFLPHQSDPPAQRRRRARRLHESHCPGCGDRCFQRAHLCTASARRELRYAAQGRARQGSGARSRRAARPAEERASSGGPLPLKAAIGQPPASVVSRPVVARLTPPPQAVPFTARQAGACGPSWPAD